MQYKTLVALLLATMALAAPAADSSLENSDSANSPEGEILIYEDVPSSILVVLETAIPTPWVESFYTNSAFRSSEINEVMHGTYPAWYNGLPESVKDWGTPSSYFPSEMPTTLPCTGSSGVVSTSRPSSTPLASSSSSASTSSSTRTMTTTAGGSSASESGSGSTPTSNAGAPAAFGGAAMSFAGAAGILGLAIVL